MELGKFGKFAPFHYLEPRDASSLLFLSEPPGTGEHAVHVAPAVEQLVGAVLAVDLGVAVGAPRDALAALAREVRVAPFATLSHVRSNGGHRAVRRSRVGDAEGEGAAGHLVLAVDAVPDAVAAVADVDAGAVQAAELLRPAARGPVGAAVLVAAVPAVHPPVARPVLGHAPVARLAPELVGGAGDRAPLLVGSVSAVAVPVAPGPGWKVRSFISCLLSSCVKNTCHRVADINLFTSYSIIFSNSWKQSLHASFVEGYQLLASNQPFFF